MAKRPGAQPGNKNAAGPRLGSGSDYASRILMPGVYQYALDKKFKKMDRHMAGSLVGMSSIVKAGPVGLLPAAVLYGSLRTIRKLQPKGNPRAEAIAELKANFKDSTKKIKKAFKR